MFIARWIGFLPAAFGAACCPLDCGPGKSFNFAFVSRLNQRHNRQGRAIMVRIATLPV
jgi:hypothetical protein